MSCQLTIMSAESLKLLSWDLEALSSLPGPAKACCCPRLSRYFLRSHSLWCASILISRLRPFLRRSAQSSWWFRNASSDCLILLPFRGGPTVTSPGSSAFNLLRTTGIVEMLSTRLIMRSGLVCVLHKQNDVILINHKFWRQLSCGAHQTPFLTVI